METKNGKTSRKTAGGTSGKGRKKKRKPEKRHKSGKDTMRQERNRK